MISREEWALDVAWAPASTLTTRSTDQGHLDEPTADKIRSHSGSHRLYALDLCSVGRPTEGTHAASGAGARRGGGDCYLSQSRPGPIAVACAPAPAPGHAAGSPDPPGARSRPGARWIARFAGRRPFRNGAGAR